LARLKVLGDLNLVERRRPQDGQFRIRVDDRDLDVRLATLATVSGERAVLRLTEVQHQRRRLHELGLPDDVASRLRRALGAPSGMVICAGPTGAGKTTTLYAALGELDDGTRHLATIEDPVEHVIDGVCETIRLAMAEANAPTASRTLEDYEGQLARLGVSLSKILHETPGLFRILLLEATSIDPQMTRRITDFFDWGASQVEAYFENGMQQGFLRSDLDKQATAHVLVGMIFSTIQHIFKISN
jgi:hypothetical protein